MVENMIMSFRYYLEKGSVRKDTKDVNRAKSLSEIVKKRMETARKMEPNFKLEFAYESVIESIEAVMAVNGYKSYSHEANIAYLRVLSFPESVVVEADKLRIKRHRSKYYGGKVPEEEGDKAIKTAERIIRNWRIS
ncbi:MAG: hypothetical protein DRP16_01835 [Candidatus Aenigmatarchaeota archaeon]|nr:MAG: hypothetical protein DRP16_01835 [Candidatus Aenigmarchaeota archaeon]